MKALKKAVSCIAAAVLAAQVFYIGTAAENADATYDNYASAYGNYSHSGETLSVNAGTDVYEDYSGVYINNGASKVDYSFTVPKDAAYEIEISYLPTGDNGNNVTLGVMIDGSYPFYDAQEIVLPRYYKDADGVRTDAYGNEYANEQVDYGEFVSRSVFDSAGVRAEPFVFYFSGGTHTVSLLTDKSEFVLQKVSLVPPENTLSYSDYIKAHGNNEYGGEDKIFEAEITKRKSTRSIVPKSDSSSVYVSPSDPVKTKINYIGNTNWQVPTEEIVWEIEAPEDGLYKLGFSFKQDQLVNGYSYRWLKIDNKTPFKEAMQFKFGYDTGWQYTDLTDNNGEPYLFYLTKGKHELSMSVTLGETARFYTELEAITGELGDLYVDIAMITGESPDANRDYDLFAQIPDLNDTLQRNYDAMNAMVKDMQNLMGKRGSSYIAAIQNMAQVVSQMIKNPYTAQQYLSNYYTNYTTVCSWLYEMKKMPLSLDTIQLSAPKAETGKKNVNIFKRIAFGAKRFFISFSSDYNNVSDKKDNAIKIWVNWGRDQAMVLNNMIQESFTDKTGIDVNLEVTNATLINGMLSGNAPDLALHMARTEPVNLAMRGALLELSQFSDYNEVIKRFGESASMPYKYGNGVYALPDTQNFYLMFYRKDILDELGISVPQTWEEFLAATAVLQRNNMQAYLPYTQITTSTTVNTGVGGLNLFASILQQYGGAFYNNEMNASALNSATALSAFTFWTDMYTKYKIPTVQNFYNRFRIGTTPLGIENYTNYTMLSEAAPEIKGRWGIALVPGIENEDGTMNRTVSGSGTGCAILKGTKHPKEAWEFLKWWTDEDTQLKYNNEVESILGAVSRVTTATVGAFERMSWDADDLEILLEQRSYIQEIPEIPGSYYVSRAVDQAYWNVINKMGNTKDILLKWHNTADEEIKLKISEYPY